MMHNFTPNNLTASICVPPFGTAGGTPSHSLFSPPRKWRQARRRQRQRFPFSVHVNFSPPRKGWGKKTRPGEKHRVASCGTASKPTQCTRCGQWFEKKHISENRKAKTKPRYTRRQNRPLESESVRKWLCSFFHPPGEGGIIFQNQTRKTIRNRSFAHARLPTTHGRLGGSFVRPFCPEGSGWLSA